MTMPDRDYAIVERDDVAIHLLQKGKATTSGSVHIFTDELDELFAELEKRGTPDFRALDDSGNELKSTELES